MRCPNCKLINPDDAERCDCGWSFVTGRLDQPIQGSSPATTVQSAADSGRPPNATSGTRPADVPADAVSRMGSFDLGRFTWAGWLVFLLSAAAGIAAMMGLEGSEVESKTASGANFNAFAAIFVAIAVFFATKVVLRSFGIPLVRPPAEESE